MKTDHFGGWLAGLPKPTVGQREKLTRALSSFAEADEVFRHASKGLCQLKRKTRKCGGAACKHGRVTVFCIVGGHRACPDTGNRMDRSFQRPAEFAAQFDRISQLTSRDTGQFLKIEANSILFSFVS